MSLSLESSDHCLIDDVELFDKSFNVGDYDEEDERDRVDAYADLASRHYA